MSAAERQAAAARVLAEHVRVTSRLCHCGKPWNWPFHQVKVLDAAGLLANAIGVAGHE